MYHFQGLCEYVLESTPEVLKDGVIVGYDARHNSRRFLSFTISIIILITTIIIGVGI